MARNDRCGSVIHICADLLHGGGCLFSLEKENSSDLITASASGEDPNYGTLNDKSAYYYTDDRRIDGFRDGSNNSDTSSTEVHSSATHGSAANPFVINTVAQWTHFAGDTTNAQNANNVFVLGSDLDFQGKTFTPVPSLSAKFYGTNHKLKNITHSFGDAGVCGVFCVVKSGSAVTDLSLEKINMSGILCDAAGEWSGSLIGDNQGASVLNCHVTGTMSGSNTFRHDPQENSSSVSAIGGMIGMVRGNIYVYRCSVKLKMVMTITVFNANGGIVGNLNFGGNLKMYDCLAILDYSVTAGSTAHDMYIGGLVNLSHQRNSISTLTMDSCVVYLDTKYVGGSVNCSEDAPILTGYGSSASATAPNYSPSYRADMKISNIFASGMHTLRNGTRSDTYGAVWYGGQVISAKFLEGCANVNWYASSVSNSGNNASTYVNNILSYRGVPNTQYNGTTGTRAKLYSDAVASTFLNEDIWVNKSKISETYMTDTNLESTTGYSIDYSPVKNPLVVRVSYYDYKNGADESIKIGENAGPFVKKAGDLLESPAARPNRTFVGWTTDKNWTADKLNTDEAPFKEMPADLLGDNKLYAVWQDDGPSAQITARLGSKDLPYDTTNGYTGEYDGTGIVLTAGLTSKGMTDPQINYQWERGTPIGDAKNQSHVVKFVKDNGYYAVTLKYTSKSEPLFFGEVTSDAKLVTMSPVSADKLSVKGVRFPTDQHPYAGADLETAVPTGDLALGTTKIDATVSWENSNDSFKSGSKDSVVNGDNETRNIVFKPDEDYGGNYGEYITYSFTYPLEYLKFTFTLTGFSSSLEKLEVNLNYGHNYSYSKIAELFEEAMAPHMDRLGGRAPIFELLDKREYKIADYRKLSGTAYENVSDPDVLKITVRFEVQSHTVTLNPNGGTFGEGVEVEPQIVRYGNTVNFPNNPTNGQLLFIGWYYETEVEDESGNKKTVELEWDVDDGRVTRDVTLTAKWLAADNLEKIEAFTNGGTYTANQEIDPTTLTVYATFTGEALGTGTSQRVKLASDQFIVECLDPSGTKYTDNKVHVYPDGSPSKILVKYIYYTPAGVKQEQTDDLLITPKKVKLDTEKLIKEGYFGDATREVIEGTAQKLEIAPGRVAYLFSPIMDDSDVTYEYSKFGIRVEPEEVMTEGEYSVVAHFTVDSPDFEAPDIKATLTIVSEISTLTVTWDKTEFTFNSKVQHPVPSFSIDRGDGTFQKVEKVNYHLEGSIDAVNVGSDYYVSLVLDDTGYKLGGFEDCPFVIKKAKVVVPKQILEIEYRGKELDLNSLDEADYITYFEGLDPNLVLVGDGAKAINVGSYKAYITLKDPANSEWDGATTARVTMDWVIAKAQLSVFWGNESAFEYNGEIQYPEVQYFIGLVGDDATAVDVENDVSYNIKDIKADVGGYTISMSFKSGAVWAKNYELDDTKSFSFAIVPVGAGSNVIFVYIDWGTTTRFIFNGDFQGPSYKFRNKDGNAEITDSEFLDLVQIENETARWADKYTMTISLDTNDTYFLVSKTSCDYTILKAADGSGENPDKANPANPDDPGATGEDPRTDTNQLPLWQLIVTGISVVLFVVCTAKAFNNYNKAKAAKKEKQRLAAITYSFAAAPLLAIEFLGMGETAWTVIACVSLGLFLLAFAAMLLMGKKRRDAELALAREEARIADEKEYAREEEQLRREEEQRRREEQLREEQRMREEQMREDQARRDNEFKMMFAAMQQGFQQPQMQYGDMQNLIASTVSALLPGLQQMQALPPAQSDTNAYSAPDESSGYAAPVSEADLLRQQMAQQQAQIAQQLADQQAQMAAQMAQQQELINRLLENQNQPAAPAYDDGYDEAADEAMWIDESDEIVSLEELYGNLSDDAKRFYYEIGSYIMSKPRTSQNDGKYAVLFKYRGKTLFKLCIKVDAPVFYYLSDGGMSEIRIADISALQAAKSVVDMQVRKVDMS